MKLLALQLKRIGDLILTTPALHAARRLWPDAEITLVTSTWSSGLLPAIGDVDRRQITSQGSSWSQVAAGRWDLCLDFTGTDRSALLTALSRARERRTFAWLRRHRWRAIAYNRWVEANVREEHTVDLHRTLVQPEAVGTFAESTPRLSIPEEASSEARRLREERGVVRPYVLVHPGTARPEKYWQPERWAEVIRHLHDSHGLQCVLTGGDHPFEQAHAARIRSAAGCKVIDLAGQCSLLALASLVAEARLVLSCDTAVVHLAAAFSRPQVALYGPTNPRHWRARHANSVVISATSPTAPLESFPARMTGASMEGIPVSTVVSAAEELLCRSETILKRG